MSLSKLKSNLPICKLENLFFEVSSIGPSSILFSRYFNILVNTWSQQPYSG